MENSRRAREQAEALLPGPTAPHRSEKGTAGGIIAADLAARHAKTERLRAARLAQQALDVEAASVAEPVRKKRATKGTAAAAKTTGTARKAPAQARKKTAAV
ncbi:hypothetical protein DYI37_04785 [Fulvimarina endophytica]|uniref:Uncharacterized protein n=1 Tax=Fulvimarina endophytica TaxID=2293836 RepID=A0A371X7E9_9HYPH|nr:hypothetical protein [Fulvimarina endophytica]RFC65169.1 hypothetical protein DYI37_04785 [Fulvimarina endophytica]